jgi:cytochrome c oxidase assembly factor CtaG
LYALPLYYLILLRHGAVYLLAPVLVVLAAAVTLMARRSCLSHPNNEASRMSVTG